MKHQVVHKFPLEVTDLQRINLPLGAKILALQVQYGQPCLWALVDPEENCDDEYARTFATVGTGNEFADISDAADLQYIGTYQLQNGAFVYHVFEVVQGEDDEH